MRRDRPARVVSVIFITLLAVACGGTPDRAAPGPEQASGVPGPASDQRSEGGSADGPGGGGADGHREEGAHRRQAGPHSGAEPDGTRPHTTEQTLAAMRALDPAHLDGLHDHHRADAASRAGGSQHPNGIDPDRIVIPAIGVDAAVIDLGLQADGAMEVPTDFAQAGWFRPGPRPGRVGPAVIAGHVDSRSGPAVFHRLTELEAGDEIEVHGPRGEVVTFAVRDVEQQPKDRFPTERVFAGTPGPELRLITCGGVFDQDERSYRDNVIVYAERIDR